MMQVISMGYHQQIIAGESKKSGLCILQVIFEAITMLTGSKMVVTLKALFEPLTKPTTQMGYLETNYRSHNESLAQLEAIGIHVDPIIRTFLLQQMTSIVASETKNNMWLSVFKYRVYGGTADARKTRFSPNYSKPAQF